MARQLIVDESSGVVSDLTQQVVRLIDRAIDKTESSE
jgi:hypothetical protein